MRAALIPSMCENKLPRGTWGWFCPVLFVSVVDSGIFLKTECFGFVIASVECVTHGLSKFEHDGVNSNASLLNVTQPLGYRIRSRELCIF